MSAHVRRATIADLDAVVTLVAEYCVADGHDFDGPLACAGLTPLLTDDAIGVVWVVDVGGTLDGYAVVTWGWSIEVGGWDVVLDEIYTRARGAGLGTLLLDHLEADCRRRDVKRIFLETERPNERARRLYARHGFSIDDSIWMSKELT